MPKGPTTKKTVKERKIKSARPPRTIGPVTRRSARLLGLPATKPATPPRVRRKTAKRPRLDTINELPEYVSPERNEELNSRLQSAVKQITEAQTEVEAIRSEAAQFKLLHLRSRQDLKDCHAKLSLVQRKLNSLVDNVANNSLVRQLGKMKLEEGTNVAAVTKPISMNKVNSQPEPSTTLSLNTSPQNDSIIKAFDQLGVSNKPKEDPLEAAFQRMGIAEK